MSIENGLGKDCGLNRRRMKIPSDGLLNKPVRALQLRNLLLDLLSPKTEKKKTEGAFLEGKEIKQHSLRILMAEDNPTN